MNAALPIASGLYRPWFAAGSIGVLLVLAAMVAAFQPLSPSHDSATARVPVVNSVPTTNLSHAQPVRPAPVVRAMQFSPGVAGALRLLDAGVSREIVKSYIENTPAVYALNTEEIIALNQRGVAPDLIVAMLARSGEQRTRAPAGFPTTTVVPGPWPGTVGPGPGYDAVAPATYAPEPGYPSSSYNYFYSYSYPSYPGYAVWWSPLANYAFYRGHHGGYARPYAAFGGARGYRYPFRNASFQQPFSVGPDWGASSPRLNAGPDWGASRNAFATRPMAFAGRAGGAGMHSRPVGRR